MSFTPTLFLSNLRSKDGPARANRFKVVLPIPRYIGNFISTGVLEQLLNLPNTLVTDITDWVSSRTSYETTGEPFRRTSNPSITRYLSLQCDTAELPGKTLQTADVKVYGPTFKVPYQSQYADTSLTFLCTNDFYERKLFDRWLEAIHPSDTNNLRFPKGQSSRYMTNIKIIQYDEFIKQIYAVELIDAFPVGVAPQALNWGEDGFHRLQVQFAYQKLRVQYEGTYNLAAAATALFGAAGSRLLPFGNAATRLPF